MIRYILALRVYDSLTLTLSLALNTASNDCPVVNNFKLYNFQPWTRHPKIADTQSKKSRLHIQFLCMLTLMPNENEHHLFFQKYNLFPIKVLIKTNKLAYEYNY